MRLVKNRNFVLVFLGWNISCFGTMLQDFGFSLYVLMLTGSAVKFSITLCIQIVPQVLFAPLGGYVSDRFNRKHLAVLCDLASTAVVSWALASYLLSGPFGVGFVYLCVFLLSSVSTFAEPAQGCIFQGILDPAEYTKARSVNAVVKNSVTLLAPAAAGMFFGVWGIVPVLLINAVSFLCSALLQCGLSLQKEHIPDAAESGPLLRSIREGMDYIRHEPFILSFLFVFCALNVISPVITVGAPVIAKNLLRLGAGGIGLIGSSIAADTLLGSLLTGLFSSRLEKIASKKIVTACICTVFAALVLLFVWLKALFAIFPMFVDAAMLILLAFVFVLPETVMQIVMTAEFQRVVPNSIMGRAMALVNAVLLSSAPLGQILAGFLLAGKDASTAFLVEAFLTAALLAATVLRSRHTARAQSVRSGG